MDNSYWEVKMGGWLPETWGVVVPFFCPFFKAVRVLFVAILSSTLTSSTLVQMLILRQFIARWYSDRKFSRCHPDRES
jgi:hypothetical protein